MLSQLSEQVKKSSQPASDLFAANVKAMQAVSQEHAALVSGMLGDSMKLMQSLGQQTEVNGMIAVQSVYAASIRERLTASSKTTLGSLNAVGQEFANAMRTSFDTAAAAPTKAIAASAKPASIATPVQPVATVKKTTVKKTAIKKVVAKKLSATKSSSSKTEAVSTPKTQKSVTKNATDAKPLANAKPAVKKEVKPLPILSADNVRATPKKAVTPKSSDVVSKESIADKAQA